MWNNTYNIPIAVGLFALALGGGFWLRDSLNEVSPNVVAASPSCANIVASADILAKAAFAQDVKTGKILYTKNPDAQLPLASLTKLTTAYTAFQILKPSDTVTISSEDVSPDGDAGLNVGEKWKAQNLLDYTLMVSANDGIHAIANAAAGKARISPNAFIVRMNDTVHALGMSETYYTNDTGLDVSSTTASAYGSARDVATLMTAIVKHNPRLLEDTHMETSSFVSLSGVSHLAENTSGAVTALPSAIASKTGYTDLAGGNLAVIFEPLPGRAVVAVVLGSTRDGRDADMENLANALKTALKRVIICGDGSQSP